MINKTTKERAYSPLMMAARKTQKGIVGLAMALMLMIVTLIIPQAPTAHAIGCAYEPYGDIGAYWRDLNEWASFVGRPSSLGCPTSPNEFDWLGWYRGRGRSFEHGIMAWWPFSDHGPFIVAMRQPPGTNDIYIDWKEDAHRRYYVIQWKAGNGPYQSMEVGRSTSINGVLPNTKYTIQINGCDDRCYGWLPEVSITTRP